MSNLRLPRPRLGDHGGATRGSPARPRESQLIGSIRLGRIFGIEISIHWSWVFIFVLITWTFAQNVLTSYFPKWTNAQLWIIGGLIAIVFFASILLHELSHSLVARRYGIPVSAITLFVFGGVSNLTKEPENAKQEFWIAIVGPLTSLAMAALYGAGYFVFHPFERGVAGVSANLAVINLAIGVFNLVPGFPLDGGRVLRSIFWSRNRSILEATRTASRIGEFVAYSIMGLGVLSFFVVDVVTGIWLFLIGNFLRGASAASYEQLFVDKVLKGIPASTVARQDYIAVRPDETVQQVLDEHVLTGHGRCFPIMAGEELLGLITLTDIRKIPRDDWATTTVYRVMTPVDKLKTVGLRDDLAGVLMIMATNDVNQVPMMDGRLLRGLIHRGDVIRYIQVRQAISSGATTH